MKKKADRISKEQALEMQIKLLKEALDNKDKTISRLEIENADLRAQLARRYRRTSEAISSDQLMLFNEAELGVEDGVLNDESDDLPEDSNAADSNPLRDGAKRKYTKRKSEYTMLNLPADTPVTVIHEEVQAPVCEACGAVKVGERVHDTVVRTTSYSIVRRITDVYECPRCDGSVRGTPKTDNIVRDHRFQPENDHRFQPVQMSSNLTNSPNAVDSIFVSLADLFDKYPGLVQTDGLSGYTFAEKNCSFTHIGCLVHVSAFFFSLIASCRNLGINPTDYLAHLFLNCNRIKNGDIEAWRSLLPGKCKLDDVIELRKQIAEAKPLEGQTEPYVLRGRKN